MKKALLILAVTVIAGVLLSSCGSHKGCPAYGKAAKATAEKRA
jgi:hypothetical protein